MALLAFELMVSVPLAVPVFAGANFTVNVVLCPAFNVAGRLGPVKLNPVPLADALDKVTAVPPEFVTEIGIV